MNSISLFAVLAVLASFSNAASLTAIDPKSVDVVKTEPKDVALTHIGTHEGTAYFVETSTKKTWTQAKTHCAQANLKLASVESQSKANFLAGAIYRTLPTEDFWTSAREARGLSGLVWDGTNTTPNGNIFQAHFDYMPSGYTACGTVYTFSGYLYAYTCPCSEPHYVLCSD